MKWVWLVTLIGALFVGVSQLDLWTKDGEQPTRLESESVTSLFEPLSIGPADVGATPINEAQEFKDRYGEAVLPSSVPLIEPPAITDSPDADNIIRALAEARGYSLQPVHRTGLFFSDNLSESARRDWQDLQAAARADGIDLYLRSAWRSVAEQRSLFRAELNRRGITDGQIASGSVDGAINDILRQIAPPGYSRHHGGYTIDVADRAAAVFEFSAGFRWLSANGYQKATEFGFIPSYPNVDNQGPDPEPWEYVWIGRNYVVE